ncbi:hypothetical protein VTP01DRAFT_6524 [Rhizomucor pusillus]|uniref:uncharacterized protein n=1 Tax=Rhizomucor pusillus TaxID=4840 RepID=UPI0037440FB5
MAHREGLTVNPHDWCMIPVRNVTKNQQVITIDGSMLVEEACDVLIKNNISSAPVYDKSPTDYVGMFDYGDVIAYLLLILTDQAPGQLQQSDSETVETMDIIRRAVRGQTVPVKLASDLSQKNPFNAILPEATVLSAIEEFACGTHRVCVLEPSGEIMGILSQSTIVRFLYENRKQFPDIDKLLGQRLRQLGLGETDVIGVNAESRVMDALSQMSHNGVSSVAVIGTNGVILGNISMTDIKHAMKGNRHQLLWSTCFQFVSSVRIEQGIEDGQDRLPVFDVRLDITLGFAIAKLLATRSHRVWVTDEIGRAAGVVSLTDITRLFAASAGLETPEQPRRASVAVHKQQ